MRPPHSGNDDQRLFAHGSLALAHLIQLVTSGLFWPEFGSHYDITDSQAARLR